MGGTYNHNIWRVLNI